MADQAKKYKQQFQKGEKYLYPSYYGSHASMVDEQATEKLNDPRYVVCKDENGTYITEKKRLDDGCADPNRFKGSRINLSKP